MLYLSFSNIASCQELLPFNSSTHTAIGEPARHDNAPLLSNSAFSEVFSLSWISLSERRDSSSATFLHETTEKRQHSFFSDTNDPKSCWIVLLTVSAVSSYIVFCVGVSNVPPVLYSSSSTFIDCLWIVKTRHQQILAMKIHTD